MILLFCAIGLVLLIAGLVLDSYVNWDASVISVVGMFVFIVFGVGAIIVGVEYSECTIIDDKIALYETENEAIEQRIEAVLSDYIKYEADNLEKYDADSAMVLLQRFPDLKANDMFVKQAELYQTNMTEIKKLRAKKLEYRLYAWWLFFGGKED